MLISMAAPLHQSHSYVSHQSLGYLEACDHLTSLKISHPSTSPIGCFVDARAGALINLPTNAPRAHGGLWNLTSTTSSILNPTIYGTKYYNAKTLYYAASHSFLMTLRIINREVARPLFPQQQYMHAVHRRYQSLSWCHLVAEAAI